MTFGKAKRPLPTWVQPHRTVLRRWREKGTTWVELECGHIDAATGLDLATALRCDQCNPVPRNPPARAEGW
jgi:hypothetical protein